MTGWHAYDALVSTGCDAILAAAILAGLWLIHRAGMRRLDTFRASERRKAERLVWDSRVRMAHYFETLEAIEEQKGATR